jgi:hypothetical protein
MRPDSALVPNEGGNPDGNLGMTPERLGGKPIRMLIGTHSDTVDHAECRDVSSCILWRESHSQSCAK